MQTLNLSSLLHQNFQVLCQTLGNVGPFQQNLLLYHMAFPLLFLMQTSLFGPKPMPLHHSHLNLTLRLSYLRDQFLELHKSLLHQIVPLLLHTLGQYLKMRPLPMRVYLLMKMMGAKVKSYTYPNWIRNFT